MRDIVAIALATLGALVVASLIVGRDGYGYLPQIINEGLFLSVGLGAYGVPVAAWALAAVYGLERKPRATPRIAGGLGLLLGVFIIALHLRTPLDGAFFTAEALRRGGGYLGAVLGWALLKTLGPAGSWIVLGGAGLAALLLVSQATAEQLVRTMGRSVANGAARTGLYAKELPARLRVSLSDPEEPPSPPSPERRAQRRRRPPSRVDLDDEPQAPPAGPATPLEATAEPATAPPTDASTPDAATPEQPSPARAPRKPSPPRKLGPPVQRELPQPDKPHATYRLPSMELLTAVPEEKETPEMRRQDAQRVAKLEDTLESFGIQAKVVHYERGPVLTRYEVSPDRGIKVSQVARLADDLAMSLAAIDVRVEAPIPGKSAIGIEVPNESRGMVSLRSVLESESFQRAAASGDLPIALGRDIAGLPVVVDLARMPHLLIAGATGSGKSVCLHSTIVSLLMCRTPDQVRFLIIDPKRVEMAIYDGIAHLMAPVVHSVKQGADVLRKAIREMEKRYQQFAIKGVVNLAEYNELARMPKESIVDEFEPLPRVVIIIDELADLMMQARAEFEFSICRIAQLARATGIHLVLATQRPSVKVITGNIKANIPSRVALAVASQHDSRTILDGQGAERLIGQGDMLYAPLEAPKPQRMQGAFVSRPEIEKVVAHVRLQGEPQFQIIPEVPEGEDDFGGELEVADELYAEAVRYVVETGEASVSMVQRRFKVGYARAGRLIDMMQQRGVVGPHEGSKPRQVLIGPGGLEAALMGLRRPEARLSEPAPRPAQATSPPLEEADDPPDDAPYTPDEEEYPFYEELEDGQ